jgi:hypothetical protein
MSPFKRNNFVPSHSIEYIKSKFLNHTHSGKIYNISIIIMELILISLSSLFKNISSSIGYEGIVWKIVMYLALLFHLKITWTERNNSNLFFVKLATFFLVFWILLCLEITIWHDVLVKWFGKWA